MNVKKEISLSSMKSGQTGRVIGISGGHRMIDRLNMLDIRPGKKIKKISSMFLRGPITLQVDGAQVAIGYRMASRIIVQVE